MKKKILLGLSIFGLLFCAFAIINDGNNTSSNQVISSISQIEDNNKKTFVVKESTDAEDEVFGDGVTSPIANQNVKSNKSVKRSINEEDLSLTKPKIGYQVAYSDDGNNVSIRYTAAINSLNVNATWTRAMYDSEGNAYDGLLEAEMEVVKAYTGLTNDGSIIYAVDVKDDLGNNPFNYYVVYTLLDIPLVDFGTYYLDAFLTIENENGKIVSSVGAVEVKNTNIFSYERGTNEDLEFTKNEKDKSYKVKGKNTDNTDIVIPGYYNDGEHRYKVDEIEAEGFKDHQNIVHIEVPKTVETVGENAFKGASNAHIYNRNENAGPKWDENWNPDDRPNNWHYIGYKEEKDGLIYTICKNSDNEVYAELSGYTDEVSDNPNIREKLNGVPVTTIGKSSFRNSTITKMEFPDSIETIESAAFYYGKLTSIKFGNGLKTISDYAFYQNSNYKIIEKINFPSSIEKIGEKAFYGVGKDTEYFLPNSLVNIGNKAFYHASQSQSVQVFFYEGTEIPTTWKNSGLFEVNSIIRTNAINTECVIKENGFEYFLNENNEAVLTKITNSSEELVIPEYINGHKIVKFGPSLLRYFGTGPRKIIIEAKIVEIPYGCFKINSSKLEEVVLPETVKMISDYAFTGTDITSIDLSNITYIGSSAFWQCFELQEVYIPSTVEYIGSSAFNACNNVTIYCENDIKPSAWSNSWAGDAAPFVTWNADYTDSEKINNGTFIYSMNNEKVTINGYVGSSTAVVIPETIGDYPVTKIGAAAFRNSSITSIEFPDSIETIETAAFYNGKLTSIKFGNGLRTIGDYAFYNNSNYKKIEKINFPCSLETIGEKAFYSVGFDTEYFLPNSLVNIGKNAFYHSHTSQSVQVFFYEGTEIPTTWKYSGLFEVNSIIKTNARNTECVIIENGFGYILNENNEAILTKLTNKSEELIIPEYINGHKIVKFGPSLLRYYGTGPRKIIIEAKITEIPYGCFKINSSILEEVVLPETVTKIDDLAFSGTKISSINLKNITYIGWSTFWQCVELKEVYIPNTVEYIGLSAFDACNNVTIYCESESKPSAWSNSWAGDAAPFVNWGVPYPHN